jgi:ATP-dependent Clp protease ATP-binding subunit ClpX
VACGAFSGFEELLKAQRDNIGFRQQNGEPQSVLTIHEAASFQKFGFLPELIGRFSRIVRFPPLPEETLRLILAENVLPQFRTEFAGEGLQLTFTPEAIEFVLSRCQKRGTGARGLQTEVLTALEEAAFENFMQRTDAEVVIDCQDGHLMSLVR